ncbi:MAG: hypothetical protein ACUVV6_06910 [Thermoplasmatota archaeon]
MRAQAVLLAAALALAPCLGLWGAAAGAEPTAGRPPGWRLSTAQEAHLDAAGEAPPSLASHLAGRESGARVAQDMPPDAAGGASLSLLLARPGKSRAIFLHCNITQPSVSLSASADDQLAVLTGKVTVDYVTVLVVTVELSCSVDLGWASAVTPSEMSFNAPGSLPFAANVTVPGGTTNRSAVLTVRAFASVQGVPSDSDQDQATVDVGTQDGGGPVEPLPRPEGGSRKGVRVLNMPLLVSLVSLGAVLGAYLALRFRRGTRRGRGGPARLTGSGSKKGGT